MINQSFQSLLKQKFDIFDLMFPASEMLLFFVVIGIEWGVFGFQTAVWSCHFEL